MALNTLTADAVGRTGLPVDRYTMDLVPTSTTA